MLVKIGKGIALDCDMSKLGLPPESALSDVAAHIVYLGLRNTLMDAHAGITTDQEGYVASSRAVSEKKLAAMYAGEVRATGGTRETDPVRAEAKRLAIKDVMAALKKAGKTVGKDGDVPYGKVSDTALSILDRYMAVAKKNVEAAKAIEAPAIDIDAMLK
jgi:hypothetical protein